jgi:hypothetical protein
LIAFGKGAREMPFAHNTRRTAGMADFLCDPDVLSSQPLEWYLEEHSSRHFVGPYLLDTFDESGPNVSAIPFDTSQGI